MARFVGINLLFTTSPLFDPMVTAPGLDGQKITHIEMFEDDPASNGLDWIDVDFINHELQAFQPYYDLQVNLEDQPIDSGAKNALTIFGSPAPGPGCWEDFGDPFAELFCYFDQHLADYVPIYGPTDYVGEVFAFNTTDESLGVQFGLLGFADDNWVDGTQSYVFEFGTATYRQLGYGFTSTTVHELGHHIGMSHPHDGYDSEFGLDYGPADDFYFAWSGDESDTVMNYLGVSNSFGMFDQDNMYRYETAGYLNLANSLLDDILADPHARRVRDLVSRAQRAAERSLRQFDSWRYQAAATNAYQAYTFVLAAADQLGISVSGLAARMAPTAGPAPHEGDPIRFPDN